MSGKKIELSDAAKKARAAYMREWRARNKDKVRASIARHWEKEAERKAQNA